MWWWLAALVAWVVFVSTAVKPRLMPASATIAAKKKPALVFTFILLGGLVSLTVSYFMLRAMYASGSVLSYRVCPSSVGERLAIVKRFGRAKSDLRIDWLDTATGKRVAVSAVPDGARFVGQTGDLVWMKTADGGLVAWSAVTGRRSPGISGTPTPDRPLPRLAVASGWPKPPSGTELGGVVTIRGGYALLFSDEQQYRSEIDAVDSSDRLLWRY